MEQKNQPAGRKPVEAAKADDGSPRAPEASEPPRRARALVSIVGEHPEGRLTEDGKTHRWTYEAGQDLPEAMLAGLAEGKHYTRGRLPSDPKPRVTLFGKEARVAKVTIVGHDPKGERDKDGKLLRYDFVPGSHVPLDQLEAGIAQGTLKEGQHFE